MIMVEPTLMRVVLALTQVIILINVLLYGDHGDPQDTVVYKGHYDIHEGIQSMPTLCQHF